MKKKKCCVQKHKKSLYFKIVTPVIWGGQAVGEFAPPCPLPQMTSLVDIILVLYSFMVLIWLCCKALGGRGGVVPECLIKFIE